MCMSGRLTECDDQYDYMVVRGGDHKAGRESPEGRFKDLEKWTLSDSPEPAPSTTSGAVYMAYISKN